ncbi:MAG: hypothetical protein D6762_01050 [Candidatus Neomarinimicrobiota bacterium]|nr:MAG: hypothetical protein D6762_01050 [Candidatus Neomarinimicrobiota bacterium]
MRAGRVLFLVLGTSILLTCSRKPESPRLVVFLVLDQCRPDVITRYEPLYRDGFRWLLDHSLTCTQVFHQHGYTATGPGHFTLSTGSYPGPAGILGNNWWSRTLRRTVYCVEDTQALLLGGEGPGRSYRNTSTPALGDWLQAQYPDAKVVSVAGKDRASIFLGGRRPDVCIWYNWDGHFVTSNYYADSIPDWLARFNSTSHIETYRDSMWTKSLPDSVYLKYARDDFFPGEVDSYRKDPYSPVFPIGFDHGDPPEKALKMIGGTPWLDRLTLQAAEAAIQGERLGADDSPDLLFLSLSGVDWMIHYFGPYSQEVMDSQIKLDKELGHFFRTLDTVVGLDRVLVVQTADHGGLPLPEYLSQVRGQAAGRINAPLRKAVTRALNEDLQRRTGIENLVTVEGPGLYIDHPRLEETTVPLEEIKDVIRSYYEKIPGIGRILFLEDLLAATPSDTLEWYLKHTMNEQGPDAWALEKRNWVWKYPFGTGHGSPYSYDRKVPLRWARSQFSRSEYAAEIHTIDLAPTLAAYLGVTPPDSVDGVVRDEIVSFLKGD